MDEKELWVKSVYSLPTAANVCQQELREIIRLPAMSMAHVTMEPDAISLLHKHQRMNEAYFMLLGEGVLRKGNEALSMLPSAFAYIPHGVVHRLRNGSGLLEHLVFAIPPFDPLDVVLVEEDHLELTPTIFQFGEPFKARDGASVYKLGSVEQREQNKTSFAYGILEGRKKAQVHWHKKSHELYYIISGKGNAYLDKRVFPIKRGSVVNIPIGIRHGLENTSDSGLEVMCVASPEYQEGDYFVD